LFVPFAHETAGAARTRHSLRPLIFRGWYAQNPDANAPREYGIAFDVIARSAATKQSSFLAAQWIASLALAMTAWEMPAMKSRSRGVLDRPVKPGR
jgi:4'-phosphopantetheinyl transferase EntD